MTSMVEKVAIAIGEKADRWTAWEACGDGFKEICREYAVAAIEAMREPTKAMCDSAPTLPSMHAVDDLPLAKAGYRPGAIQNLKRWRAMVDASLVEESAT